MLCALFTSAHAVPPRLLFQRRDTCADQKLGSCPSDLPEEFCCPENTTCIALAGGTTALCCPKGETCERIAPLTCNLAAQDPAKFPTAGVKTTVLHGKLEKCAGECCPFGYTCNDDDQCEMDKDQSKPPDLASDSDPAPPSGTTGSPVPSSISDEDEDDGESKDKKAVPTTAIIVGVLLGVLGLVAAIVFILIWRSKRRKEAKDTYPSKASKTSPRQSLASSSFGNINCNNSSNYMPNISGPMMNDGTMRTDFTRKPESARTAPLTRVSGIYRSGPSSPSSGSVRSNTAIRPIRDMRSNPRQPSRFSEVSSLSSTSHPPLRGGENIDGLASPGAARNRRDTSFSGLMDKAGLGPVHRGRPYVPEDPPRI